MNANAGSVQGFPPIVLLIFTILIWILFLSIFLSNHQNKQNRWCFVAGMIFSLGAFKEYLLYGMMPVLTKHFPGIPEAAYYCVYSWMTAVLYYFAMPSVAMLSLYFSSFDQRNPKVFQRLKYLIFAPGVLTGFIVPYWETRNYQLNVKSYFIYAGIYNWIYGIFITWLLLSTLYRTRQSFAYKQKEMVSINVLLPMWYWLITVFAFHILRMRPLFKAWQGNIFVILFLLGYFVIHVFQDGIWGTRVNLERYDWTKNTQAIQRNADYVSHALKNELAKIKWCAQIISEQPGMENSRELQIIRHSTDHLEEFLQKTRLQSKDITLQITRQEMKPFLERCIAEFSGASYKADLTLECAEGEFLCCDSVHLQETIHNLLKNAVEATGKDGYIQVSFFTNSRKKCAVLRVKDTGCGLDKEEKRQIFRPYYTTKPADSHLGLGLYYCYHVMDKHHGRIEVESEPGKGTEISLYFPLEEK